THLLAQALLIVAPLFAAVLAVGVLTNVAQVGWKVTTNALRPKFSRMNPISGAKRLFSAQILVDLCKSLLKFAIIGYVIYNALKRELDRLPALSDMGLFESVSYLGDLITSLGLTVGGWFILIAALDYAYTRFKHSKQLRMSKQEVKDEYKMSEGNPQIKGQIKQRMREASMRRMMQDVPGADVIVTNPTHYAVALRYDRQTARAPVVVAKGADHLARRIKEAGLEHHVAIAENKELARTLYVSVDVGHEIPPELYEAVAEILAFVYKLKHKGKGSL
ncbi:MAG: flagellar biosynthesis protein FlhB, partial [Clostridiales bacterium]|nr:flagellar biosynthesis protein FlhB [Clostridiales bacterium]